MTSNLDNFSFASSNTTDDFHENFQPWVQKKYHVSTSNSWAKIIMLYCGNEQEGFNTFYRLLDEFQNRDKSLEHQQKVTTSYEVSNK